MQSIERIGVINHLLMGIVTPNNLVSTFLSSPKKGSHSKEDIQAFLLNFREGFEKQLDSILAGDLFSSFMTEEREERFSKMLHFPEYFKEKDRGEGYAYKRDVQYFLKRSSGKHPARSHVLPGHKQGVILNRIRVKAKKVLRSQGVFLPDEPFFSGVKIKSQVSALYSEIFSLLMRMIVSAPKSSENQETCKHLLQAYNALLEARKKKVTFLSGGQEAEKVFFSTFDRVYGDEECGEWPEVLPYEEDLFYPQNIIIMAAEALARQLKSRRDAYFVYARGITPPP